MENTDFELKETDTLCSQDTITNEIDIRSKNKQKKKTILVCLLGFFILVFLIYFALPSLQCKNIKPINNVNFSKEDFALLSSNTSYRPLIFLDEETSEKNILKNSLGLVKSCTYKSNGFTSSLTVEEDYIKGKYNGFYYTSLAKTYDESLSLIDSLSLSDKRKTEIKNSFEDECSLVPEIHAPNSVNIDDENLYKMMGTLSPLSLSLLKNVEYIVFTSESSTSSNFCATSDFIFKLDDDFYLLKECLYDYYNEYFNSVDFENKVLNAMKNTVKQQNLSKVEYVIEDSSLSINVYSFKPIIKNGTVTIIKE